MQAAFHRWSAFLYQKTYNLLYYKYNLFIFAKLFSMH